MCNQVIFFKIIIPLFIYLTERLTRFIRSLHKYTIVKHKVHPNSVLELFIDKSNNRFTFRAGQYIYLNVPTVAYFEWHPFTITSSPEDTYLTVHIRCVGDWTNALLERVTNKDETLCLKTLNIDGPYGTCAEDVHKYSTVVLIGAGIGVTPYASILSHIWFMSKAGGDHSTTLKKVRTKNRETIKKVDSKRQCYTVLE